MDKLIETLKEGEFISLTRLLTTLGYIVFLGLSLYLAVTG